MRLTEDPRYIELARERGEWLNTLQEAKETVAALDDAISALTETLMEEVTGLREEMEVLVTPAMRDYAFENADVLQVGEEMIITDLLQRMRSDTIVGKVSGGGYTAYGIPADMLQEARQQWLDRKAGGQ